ncbi:signal peptidase, endoplasmic reticulum-type [Geosporobacter subterraneus DSM 17957]|uniref:Signal peptidase I n=1 Tax=Geosporobacter subterraneus DSM 17957 TaxID=1121919 RepID=A0A1M6DH90_9FIRM|nr:signal peptidase I [Geosporobacter subterraneus]SHI72555.1 signal peptidase, endoplasmic reticulum-type [Geosporobacter subterraneus DSM 17957]
MITREIYLPSRRSKLRCGLIFAGLIIIYILDNSLIRGWMGYRTYSYFLNPCLWLSVIYGLWTTSRLRPKSRLKHRAAINLWAFNFAVIFICISVIAGLIDGLGKSPYSRTFVGMVLNIYTAGAALIGREWIRSHLVNNLTKEDNYLVFILLALLLSCTSISFNRYAALNDYKGIVQFLAQYFIPEFCHSLFATYLAFLGGPLTSIIYLGIIQGFHWLSPILPNLKWITAALIGTLCPVFFLMSMQNIYMEAAKEIRIRKEDQESALSWVITSVVSIGIIWFAVGVFPIYPSVIATGSMEPMIKPGDVILVKKILDMDGINQLKAGDVIQFRRDSILISHRIVEVKKDEEGIRYRTKGDNNSGEDTELVKPEDVKGTIIYVIPKVGWPTLLLKSRKDIELNQIVF